MHIVERHDPKLSSWIQFAMEKVRHLVTASNLVELSGLKMVRLPCTSVQHNLRGWQHFQIVLDAH